MEELFEAVLKVAMADAMKNKAKGNQQNDMTSEAKKIAEANKNLYDAHIAAGFTEEQTLAIVVAVNN